MNPTPLDAFSPAKTENLVDFKGPSTLNADGTTTYYGTPVVTPENPYTRYYGGSNKVHLCKNTKTDSKDGRDLYFVKVAGLGRGEVELMLTEVEYTRAQRRAVSNRADIPKSMTFMEFLRVLFMWK